MNRSILALVGPIGLVALWQWAFSASLVSKVVLPSPYSVILAGAELLTSPDGLWDDLGLTLARTLTSVLLSVAVGVPLGLLMGSLPRLHAALSFLVDFFRSIPPIALFPLFILAFGLGETSMVAVPFYGCVLVVIVSSAYGVLNAPEVRRDVAKVFGMTPVRQFFAITLPSALPQISSGLRLALSLALVLTIVVEMLMGIGDGLGKRIYEYHLLFDSSEMYFTIILVGALGYLLNFIFMRIEKSLVHWAGV